MSLCSTFYIPSYSFRLIFNFQEESDVGNHLVSLMHMKCNPVVVLVDFQNIKCSIVTGFGVGFFCREILDRSLSIEAYVVKDGDWKQTFV